MENNIANDVALKIACFLGVLMGYDKDSVVKTFNTKDRNSKESKLILFSHILLLVLSVGFVIGLTICYLWFLNNGLK